MYDSFVIQVEAPAKPPAKSGAPFQWDLQDLFGGSVTQPLGHGQSFVFGELYVPMTHTYVTLKPKTPPR